MDSQIFKATFQTYITRYAPAPVLLIFQGILFPFFYLLVYGRLNEFPKILGSIYLTENIQILLMILIFSQIAFYFMTQNYLTQMEISDMSIKLLYFKKHSEMILFSELSDLTLSDDLYQNFIFHFKDGTQKRINTNIKRKKQAYELIRHRTATI